jgi:hypothetical protein
MTFFSARKLAAIKAVCDYYTLTRALIQSIVGVSNDRVMRAILQGLFQTGLINKTRMQAVNPAAGSPAPVYFPTRRGAEWVAAEYDDERYLHVCVKTPDWTHLLHWLGVAEFHVRLDQAIARQDAVSLLGWYGEWDEVNPQAQKPHERYRIFTLIREKPRLVCAPDAAFALEVDSHSKTYYLEYDRNTSGLQQIANSKTPGYAALAAGRLHTRHFETTAESFTVLHFSPSPTRRDLLRKSIASKEGASLHRFAAFTDWTPELALTGAIFYPADSDDPQPLVRLPKGGAT